MASENPSLMRGLIQDRRWVGGRPPPTVAPSPISPHHRRWFFARDSMRKWAAVFKILGIDPWVYLLNPVDTRVRCSELEYVFQRLPGGTTPMGDVLQLVLGQREKPAGPTMIFALTDGEANNMRFFCAELDRIQNGVYGDVQICLMGLSLVPRDIEWFEQEECDETRIRTVEAYEVEARQIQLREVVQQESGYNWEMHSYRPLVTNYFPADYDYEAPLQNLRHRLYITLHGRDRWIGLNNPIYKLFISDLCCSACFMVTMCHCCGWCQGNECGKYEEPECLQGCCGE